jgi:hypothetical protein
MVNSVRIDNYNFPTILGSSGTSAFQTDTVINGEILKVDFKTNTTGSLTLTVSGTAQEILRRNAPSGAAWQQAYPFVYGQISTGSITAATMYPVAVNNPLILNLVGVPSGATLPTLDCTIYYR